MRSKKFISAMLAMVSVCTSYSFNAMAKDANVTEAYFKQNGEYVHTLSNGELECVIDADNAGSEAVMVNAVYEKGTDKLLGDVSYTKAENGEFKNKLNITDADNCYVSMYVWDSLSSANAKTQVYTIAAEDTAPENPWNVSLNNKGGISFSWNESEDNLKTSGYRIYKNNEPIGDTKQTSFTDVSAKWYDAETAGYKLTSYDEYGNESEGYTVENVEIDNTDMASILMSQPNINNKMSLYIATGKDTDSSWYGYNVADEIDGTACRRIPADRRAVFKYSSDFVDRIGEGAREAVISITYFDNGTDFFKVNYIGTKARYTDIEVAKTGTNKWITKEFKVSDFAAAYTDPKTNESKLQDESVNFTIWSKAPSDKGDVVDTETYISEIKIILEGEYKAPSATEQPGETAAPTQEPTPAPTPKPTIAPDDIEKASIKFFADNSVECYESEYDLMSVYWGPGNKHIENTGWYAYTTGNTKDNEECRVIADNKRLVLMFGDALNEAIGEKDRNAVIRVRYYDSGSDKIRVSYISEATRYTTVTIQKENTNQWKWAEFAVKDLANKSTQASNGVYLQDENTYLSIWSRASGENETNNTPDYISEVELVLAEADEPTEEPVPITEAEIKLLSGSTVAESAQSKKNLIKIYWGPNDKHIANTVWYGYTSGETMGGVPCRKIQNEENKNNKRISFVFSDELNEAIGNEPRSAIIRVKYYDSGTDGIRVSYISPLDPNKKLAIQKENTNEWKWAEFTVDDFVNESSKGLQDESTHFAIWACSNLETEDPSVPEYIAEVQIILNDTQAEE